MCMSRCSDSRFVSAALVLGWLVSSIPMTTAEAADASGSWRWRQGRNESRESVLRLDAADGAKIVGTYHRSGREPVPVVGHVEGDRLTVTFPVAFGEFRAQVTCEGRIDGDEVEGRIRFGTDDDARERPWRAQRTVAVDDVLGVWQLRMETPDGAVLQPKLKVTRDGGDTRGRMIGRENREFAVKNLTIENNSMRFVVESEHEGSRVIAHYTARPRGNQLVGSLEYDYQGDTGTMDFTGRRVEGGEAWLRSSGPAPVPAAAAAATGRSETATPPEAIKLLPGFAVELLHTVPRESQGSWVSLAVDDRGRLIASDQYGGMYRITIPSSSSPVRVEPLSINIGMAHGLLYAFDSLYVMVNGQDPWPTGLYRVRDTDGDDRFDEITPLRHFRGRGEHGPHAIIPSPDGKSLYICAGNSTDLPVPPPETSRVPRVWSEDHLLGRMPDARGHNRDRLAPGGWVARIDPDGSNMEIISTGFRNEFDIAFHPNGELFTYDADMEWDIGVPWYRPTRVCHVTSGSEFGWRNGTGKWPVYYPDSLPASVDIGPGSPTGIVFGTGARFPARYQQALFIADWSFGIVYAVHLEPDGSTFGGTFERFMSAAPLPVTDMVIHPGDGAMYFAIGGRRAQSGLYRLTYTGPESTEPVRYEPDDAAEIRAVRHQLEAFHKSGHPEAVEAAWPYLDHPDRFIRFAARIAIEHRPALEWRERALAETRPRALITAMVALARHDQHPVQPRVVEALNQLSWDSLDESLRLNLLRAYALAFIRLGPPDAAQRREVLARLNDHYPAASQNLNRELCRVLVYLDADDVVGRTLALLDRAATQEEQIHYAYCLRNLDRGWTLDQRRAYFGWFQKAAGHRGGASFGGFLRNIRDVAIGTLTADERAALRDVLEAEPEPTPEPVAVVDRPFVRKWTVDELLADVEAHATGRNRERGRDLFAAAACFKCHRFDGEGGTTGPDLTGAAGRYNARDLLEAIIEPSKVISDQYEATMFQTSTGQSIVGRIANLAGDNLMVNTNMLDPGELIRVSRETIERMAPSPVSMMPEGLLDTFTRDEIVDLMAYLRSGTDRRSASASE